MAIDLHTHSTASDGSFAPAEVVRRAKTAKLRALSLTDHDTAAGVEEAAEEAVRQGIDFIPGIELSVSHPMGSFHMLGYFIDVRYPAFIETMKTLKRYRIERNERMAEAFRAGGIDVSLDDVVAMNGEKGFTAESIGKPHFVNYLLEHKVIQTTDEAYKRFKGKGKPFNVKRERLEALDGINLIHQSGGLAVFAHPGWYSADFDNVQAILKDLKQSGLDGVECYYTDHSQEQTQIYLEFASALDLVVTGGTDFHGDAKQGTEIGVGEGDLVVPDDLLGPLKRAANRKKS